MKAEAYWNTLTEAQKDGFITLAETNGVSEAKTLELAIGEAYRRSPEMKAKREAEQNAHYNELLKCSRSGEMVARKDAIVAGETVVAKKALTEMEKEFFGIEDEVEEVVDELPDDTPEARIVEGTDAGGNATYIVKSNDTNETLAEFDSEAEAEEYLNGKTEITEPSDKSKAALNFIHTGRRTVPANWEAFKARYNVA